MTQIRACAEAVAKIDGPVLILGENGSGKELTARLIHKLSPRAGHRFLKVNCAGAPECVRGELFGYEPGTLSWNKPARPGKIELCDQGTILLDKITELPGPLQAEVLSLLKTKQYLRIGRQNTKPVDVRVLAAADLNVDNVQRRLHESVYYHLSACTVQLPPLRERKDEIPRLLEYYMHQVAKRSAVSARSFSDVTLKLCQEYTWPGNFRELEKFVASYMIAGNSSPMFLFHRDQCAHSTAPRETVPSDLFHAAQPGLACKSPLQSVRGEAERSAIGMALEQTCWNRKAAARLLSISYRTLLYKIQRYSIMDPKCSPSIGAPLRRVP